MLACAGCREVPADPAARGSRIAEARCACTREDAPRVARCVGKAADDLEHATLHADARDRHLLVAAYEDSFRRCPWDDPSYYQ